MEACHQTLDDTDMYLKRLGEVRAQRCQMARGNLYSLISGPRETFFV